MADFTVNEMPKSLCLTTDFFTGDGVFEGIRAYNGRVFKLKEHIDRLFYSAKAILLEIPMSHQKICEAVLQTCRANKTRDGYIRFRGRDARRGHAGTESRNCKSHSTVIIAGKIQVYPARGVCARH